MISSPGRMLRWYVLPRIICVPISSSSRGSSALTLAWVPTGMKTGVSIRPRHVVIRPRRAFELASVFSNSNIESNSHHSATKHRQRIFIFPDTTLRHAQIGLHITQEAEGCGLLTGHEQIRPCRLRTHHHPNPPDRGQS